MTVRPIKFDFQFQMQLPGQSLPGGGHTIIQIFRDAATKVMMEVTRKVPASDFDVPRRSYYIESAPKVRYDTIERLIISVRRDLIAARDGSPGGAAQEAPREGEAPRQPTPGSPSPGDASG